MKVLFNADRTHIIVKYESLKEKTLLDKFVGFLFSRKYDHFYAVAKKPVVFNLITRLKKKYPQVLIEKSVNEYISTPAKLNPLPEDFKFHTNPLKAQEVALKFLYTNNGGGLLMEPGMGKTKVVLDFIYLAKFKKTLIVCPKALCFVWEDETYQHRPELHTYVVSTTDWEYELPFINKADVVVINYSKACILIDELCEIPFNFLAVDEFLIKDHNSLRTKALTYLGSKIECRVGMSGTLINNSAEDMFAPTRFLEPSLVGIKITNFKEQYAIYGRATPSGIKPLMGYRNIPEIRAMLEASSIVMSKEVWLPNMPKKNFFEIQVPMSDEQRDIYQWIQNDMAIPTGDGKFILLENPLTVAMKLTQVSNGFVYLEGQSEEDLADLEGKERKKKNKRKTLVFKEQPKLEALGKLITGKLKSRRGLIWYNMSAERDLIEGHLNSLGISHLTIAGGEKDVGSKIRQFNRDNSVSWLVCQAKSVNYGVTTMGTSLEKLEEEGVEVIPGIDTRVYTEIFYSLNYSLEVFLQQQDRIHRISQVNDCEYYILLSTSKMDMKVRKALDEKKQLRKEMLVDWIKD